MRLPTSTSGRSARAVAKGAALLAGRMLMDRFYSEKQVRHKGRSNLVTDVDLAVEREVLAYLGREYPQAKMLAEESHATNAIGSGLAWVVDPLDGTRNYAGQVPHFAVVVALAYDGEVVLGITYDPLRKELFFAEKGKGAFLNNKSIRVSSRERLGQCLLGFDMGYVDSQAAEALKMAQALWPGMQSIRVMGSAALGLAYAAAGRVDIYIHHNLAPWDLASGLLLVQEAGGVVTDRNGNAPTLSSSGLVASNAALHRDFMRATEGMGWRTM